jgi:glycosyltransferase involved in cell wall biosynthesis
MSALIHSENRAWKGAKPTLSVLIPFFGDDPCALISALDEQSPAGRVEIILFDDGCRDASVGARVGLTLRAATNPGRLIRSPENLGRARGRNRLAAHARGEYLLFLDADMAPDSASFLRAWLNLIAAEAPAVAFGGFSLAQAPDSAELALHRRMALASDCAAVAERQRAPEKHVFTSNLLVRRDVFAAQGFDESFEGWGWEDVEWAMRVARDHSILHVDNTATHLGLDRPEAMVAKYEQSAGNFARVARRHRGLVERYPSYRAARLLKRLPFRATWRPMLKRFALAEAAPLTTRAFAMRLYRAALYAEAV